MPINYDLARPDVPLNMLAIYDQQRKQTDEMRKAKIAEDQQNQLATLMRNGATLSDLAKVSPEYAKMMFEQQGKIDVANAMPKYFNVATDNGQQLVNANDPNAPKTFAPKPLAPVNNLIVPSENTTYSVNPRTNEKVNLGIAPKKPVDNTMVVTTGANGQPVYTPRPQSAGMTPFQKPTGNSSNSPTQHINDAKESNALLDQVLNVGPTATGSMLGNFRDKGAAIIGMSTSGAQGAAKMKVLGASLTAKVPKMSGPQSDKDVAMYKEAAGNIADPNTPWETKMAAIETIREINNRQLSYAPSMTQPTTTQSGATTSGW